MIKREITATEASVRGMPGGTRTIDSSGQNKEYGSKFQPLEEGRNGQQLKGREYGNKNGEKNSDNVSSVNNVEFCKIILLK